MATVLYIAGLDRSGSTLLAQVLETLLGVVSVGELPVIWQHGWRDNWQCSDGVRFAASPTWQAVMHRVQSGPDAWAPAAALALCQQVQARRFRLLARFALGGTALGKEDRAYAAQFERLYQALFAVTGAQVIVDSGKAPHHAALMLRGTGLDFRVLHLVRDPRAVAQSRRRAKANINPGKTAGAVMAQHGAARVALRWLWHNRMIEKAVQPGGLPPPRLHYEDFCRQPLQSLQQVLAALALPLAPGDAGRLADGVFRAKPGPAFAGNSCRFDLRDQPIQPDEAWRTDLPATPRRVVSALTFVMRQRYAAEAGAPNSPPSAATNAARRALAAGDGRKRQGADGAEANSRARPSASSVP